MAWINVIREAQADGMLARIYQQAKARAGRIFQIVQVQSPNPATLRAGLGLYQAAVLADSPVPRWLREAVAVIVSDANDCHY